MQYDLQPTGLGLLIVMSLLFGVVAQLLIGRHATHWLWLIGAVAWFVGGLFFSEVVFATMTEDEIQPIIEGLALDESALGGLLFGIPAVIVTWYLTRERPSHGHLAT
jgi:hypothetical protein